MKKRSKTKTQERPLERKKRKKIKGPDNFIDGLMIAAYSKGDDEDEYSGPKTNVVHWVEASTKNTISSINEFDGNARWVCMDATLTKIAIVHTTVHENRKLVLSLFDISQLENIGQRHALFSVALTGMYPTNDPLITFSHDSTMLTVEPDECFDCADLLVLDANTGSVRLSVTVPQSQECDPTSNESTQHRHSTNESESVASACFSPDDSKLFCVVGSSRISVRDVAVGGAEARCLIPVNPKATKVGEKEYLFRCCSSWTGSTCAGTNGELTYSWNWETGEAYPPFEVWCLATNMSFGSSENILIVCLGDVVVWDIFTTTQLFSFSKTKPGFWANNSIYYRELVFNPSNNTIAVAYEGHVDIYELNTGSLVDSLSLSNMSIEQILFTPAVILL